MAYLLQGLVAAALLANLAAAAAQEKPQPKPTPKPFSHRRHMALRLQCATCHAKVAASATAEDNNLPLQDACASCHPGGRAVKPSAKRQVDRFNHQLHVKFGSITPLVRAAIAGKTYLDTRTPTHLDTANSCASCHHGIEWSEDVRAASVFPLMADCLVCHNKMDPPFSCEKCHNNVPALKPADHGPDFLDKHNRMKGLFAKAACANCHGLHFTCLGCH